MVFEAVLASFNYVFLMFMALFRVFCYITFRKENEPVGILQVFPFLLRKVLFFFMDKSIKGSGFMM